MKKLMIAFAIAVAAVFANAAEYNWGLASYDYTGPNGETGDPTAGFNAWDGGYAMFFLGTVTASSTAFDTSSAKAITTGSWDGENFVYGNIDLGAGVSSADITSTAAGQAYSIVLLDKQVGSLDGYEGNYVLLTGLSAEAGANPGSGNAVAQFVNTQSIGGTQGVAWQTMGVPEPTSGLLLLLGMAGLALRRRRA